MHLFCLCRKCKHYGPFRPQTPFCLMKHHPDGCSLATLSSNMILGCFALVSRNCLQEFLLLHKGKAVLPGLVSFVADINETLLLPRVCKVVHAVHIIRKGYDCRRPSQPFLGHPFDFTTFSHWPFLTGTHLFYGQAAFE